MSAQDITDADYLDEIALLVNTLTQAESLLHSREQTIGDIGLYMNADKTYTYVLIKKKHLHIK